MTTTRTTTTRATTEPDERAAIPAVQGGSGRMFDAIAARYDLLNRVLSLGVDQGWRRRTVAALGLDPLAPARVLDLATGTADLALLIARRLPRARVVGLDPSVKMMAEGQKKAAARGLGGRLELVLGDAEALPLADRSVDAITMAFGIRNVPDRPRALREMARVLRPGGRVAILELGEPRTGLGARLGRLYIHRVVPWIGALLSGAREYRYLEQSIARFPPPEEFAALMREAGLVGVTARRLTFGVVCLFVGERPVPATATATSPAAPTTARSDGGAP